MEVSEKKRVAAYVKLAKLWERSREKAVTHHLEYYTEKFKDSEVYELVAVYIDITGQKDIPNRPEMVHLLHDCMEGKIDVIATQTKAYLAANAADFCYLVKFLFDLDPPIHIVTEEEKYRINTITNDEDQREALYEARILTGQEHSNVLSMTFTGYQVPFGVSFLNRSMPSIVITPKGVRFNKAAHTRMNNCSHIEILYHPVMQTIAIRPCDKGHTNAVRWEDEEGNMTHSFTSRAFAEAIYENMRWRTDLNFKFRLVPRERDGVTILMASLDEPQIKLDKKTKELLGLTAESGPVQYIVHKVAEAAPADSFAGRLQHVDNSFGVSLALRKRRDQMSASITVADIQRQIQIVDNPLIGQLPTRAEMAEELDDLLMCM